MFGVCEMLYRLTEESEGYTSLWRTSQFKDICCSEVLNGYTKELQDHKVDKSLHNKPAPSACRMFTKFSTSHHHKAVAWIRLDTTITGPVD